MQISWKRFGRTRCHVATSQDVASEIFCFFAYFFLKQSVNGKQSDREGQLLCITAEHLLDVFPHSNQQHLCGAPTWVLGAVRENVHTVTQYMEVYSILSIHCR